MMVRNGMPVVAVLAGFMRSSCTFLTNHGEMNYMTIDHPALTTVTGRQFHGPPRGRTAGSLSMSMSHSTWDGCVGWLQDVTEAPVAHAQGSGGGALCNNGASSTSRVFKGCAHRGAAHGARTAHVWLLYFQRKKGDSRGSGGVGSSAAP